MAASRSRLKDFELQLANERRQQQRRREQDSRNYGFDDERRRRGRNTLGPQEDVIERRQHRNRVALSATPGNTSHNVLTENIVLLLLLAASIYGIYRLCIYILNP